MLAGAHDESVAVVRDCAVCDCHCAFDVVSDGLPGVVFEHGDVFVSGGVEDDFRGALVKDFVHPGFVADVCQARDDFGVSGLVAKLAFDLVEEEFAAFEEDELSGFKSEYLPADFASDGASGA